MQQHQAHISVTTYHCFLGLHVKKETQASFKNQDQVLIGGLLQQLVSY